MLNYYGPEELDSIASTLLQGTNLVYPPKKPQYANLGSIIANLDVHPTLEALLHILNHDLPSAHFLVRHMQALPAVEGMLLHGLLHRAEGDFPNAQAWIGDVTDACEGFQPKKRGLGKRLDTAVAEQARGPKGTEKSLVSFVYGNNEPARLVGDVEKFRRQRKEHQRTEEGEQEAIEQRIRAEGQRMLEWCQVKFGRERVVDARQAWVANSEEIGQMSRNMVSGGRGYREF